jgi:hypothetical protein
MSVHAIADPLTYFRTSLHANTIANAGTDVIAICNTHIVAFAPAN